MTTVHMFCFAVACLSNYEEEKVGEEEEEEEEAH